MTALPAPRFGPHPALARRPGGQALLCQPVMDWKGVIPAAGAIVEPKIDGIRALWIGGELVTREGAAIHGAGHIAELLRRIEHEAAVPRFFDGEFVAPGGFDATLRHFAKRGAEDAGALHVFDALPMTAWRGGDPCQALEARRTALDRMLAPFECEAVRLMPWAWLPSPMEIERQARDYIAQGGEGVVVKDPAATYRRKPSPAWQRIKRELTLDLPVIGYEPDARRPFLLGVLIVDYRGKKVRVAAGFSDAERMALWRRRESLVGSVVEIAAMEATEQGTLRQPRWVRERGDKSR